MTFTGILHTEIESVWPEVLPWVEYACGSMNGRATANDIYESLLARDMQLWVWKTYAVKACIVTQIINYPQKRYCRLNIVTGVNRDDWKDSISIIEAWAKSQGCHGMESIAREGWWRVFIRLLRGWKKTHIFIEKDFING